MDEQKQKSSKLESLEQFKSWCKENAFIFASSEIYGGFQAVYDYGHYGMLLRKNIADSWLKVMIQQRDDVVGLDSSIFMHPRTWEASGHVKGFADVLVEDKKTNMRYRADHLIEEFFNRAKDEGQKTSEDLANVLADNNISDQDIVNAVQNNDMDKLTPDQLETIIKIFGIKSADGNELAKPRNFNLLVKSNMGTTDSTMTEENVSYLRGETCQGIYLQYKNVVDNMRVKVPFGIAQIGKAFRNEIVARQFIFRLREFEQMELQYFIHPSESDATFKMWKEERKKWYIETLGFSEESLKFKPHEKLIFYATAAEDITYKFNSMNKFDEIEGIHARSDYDLTQHQQHSGAKLDYFDQNKNERFVPNIVEASSGLTRIVMAMLDNAWTYEKIAETGEESRDYRVVLKIKKEFAPIKVAILPLSKKPELQSKAKEIKKMLQSDYMCEYDETASIGKRYRRQDEIGTPYCVTVDFETANDGKVTVRDRDTMEQERVEVEGLVEYFGSKLN